MTGSQMNYIVSSIHTLMLKFMTSAEIKAIQAPLKEQYRNSPETAVVILKAAGKLSAGISCKIDTGKKLVEAGLHPATGGNGFQACSGDLLLEALVACAGVTLRAVSTSIGIDIRDGEVRAEGALDFRGTLGVSRDAPVGFKSIKLSFLLDTDATEEQMESLAKLTERYCVVFQTLAKGVEVNSRFVRNK